MQNEVRKGSEKQHEKNMRKKHDNYAKMDLWRSPKGEPFSKKILKKSTLGPNLAPRWCQEGPKTLETSILDDFWDVS